MSGYKEYESESINRIKEAKENFGTGLFAMTSFGVESGLLLNLIKKSGVDVPLLTVDTGFWFKETHQHRRTLEKQLGFAALTYRPNDSRTAYIKRTRLWESDIDKYHELTKLNPLSHAINELGVAALLSGVRSHQNENRAGLNTYGIGNDNEWRIHPVIDWPEEVVDEYISSENLPRHPLQSQGYGSVGDWTLTTPGQGRDGRNLGAKSECGLHIPINVLA